MSRAYALALRSPHLSLGLPVSMGRKIESFAKRSWIVAIAMITLACVGVYLYQVNRAASKGFTLRNLEKQLDQLSIDVETLENSSARLQALSTVEARVRELGYVRVDRMEFVDVPRGYALAK